MAADITGCYAKSLDGRGEQWFMNAPGLWRSAQDKVALIVYTFEWVQSDVGNVLLGKAKQSAYQQNTGVM